MFDIIKTKAKRSLHFLLAILAYWYYGRPAQHLIVIGVTGTKGKSTTTRFIASVLEAGGYKVGLLSTVEFQIGSEHIQNKQQMTMLGRGQIQKMLKRMVAAGCQYAVIETSSEGILQYRHVGLEYDIAVFTNLGMEHHERHGGFENLKRDKGKLFASLTKYPHKAIDGKTIPKIIVVNGDDPNSEYYLNFPADQKHVYGLHPIDSNKFSTTAAEKISSNMQGVDFLVGENKFHLNIIGDFNVYNALPAIVVGKTQGIAETKIATGLASVSVVPGRMEFINAGQPFKVIVDYAHEPMSLTALFTTLKLLVTAPSKVVGVIGSDGGGRDIDKRGRMGEVAGRLCDIVIVSDVNPWDEDPNAIAEMLAAGARKAGKIDGKDLFIIVDRRDGIKKAFSLAGDGGAVAITAKGTESAIIVKDGERVPWDDRIVAKSLLHELYSGSKSQ